jgi:hypothetical protein
MNYAFSAHASRELMRAVPIGGLRSPLPAPRPITAAMRRELAAIAWDGNPSDPYEWSHAPDALWFQARDKVLTALLKRGLIYEPFNMSGYALTRAGHASQLNHRAATRAAE